jgi:hypothetical protein
MDGKRMYDSLLHYQDWPKYQRLAIDLEYEEDPDDAYSSILPEKGVNLLHLGTLPF